MYYYKTNIKYEGTNYSGFQWQSGILTVQGEFNLALARLIAEKFSTMAASRTDSGVHALEQVVKITSIVPLELSPFVTKFNELLPPQIRCINIQSCSGNFRPAAEAKLKEYRYFFTNETQRPKEDGKFIANISNELDIQAMMACVRYLKGKHDFCNFYSSGSNVKSTIREVFSCELSEINPHEIFHAQDIFPMPLSLLRCYQFQIEATGFLKQMIRHIISALWMVGSGKLTTDEFIGYLNDKKCERQLWKVAPPNGLFLYRITY